MIITSSKNKIKTSLDKYSVFNLNKDNGEVAVKNEPIHFVQMYDRSGSMYGDLKKLTENIKETLSMLDQGDYLSILWYSGRKQTGIVIEGHRVTKADGEVEYLSKLLDKNNTTLGCTMYSEVIDEANRLIDKYSNLSSNAALSFFTDGGVNEESKSNVFETVKRIVANPNCLSFNTIGYGKYYDAEILKDMAAISPQGQYFHNSKIDDYLSTYKDKIDMNKGYSAGSVEVKNLEDKVVDVYVMTDLSTSVKKLNPNETIKFKTTKTNMNIISNGLVELKVDDGDFKEVSQLNKDDEVRSLKDNNKETMLYGMASALYQANRRDEALDIIEKELKDLNLYNKLANAFTTMEIGVASEFAKNTYLDKDLRETNTINGVISEGISVMKILAKAEDLDLSFNIDEIKKGYQSITNKSEVEQNLFVETNSQNIIPISNIKFNTKGKLNASVLLTRNGYLDLSQVKNKPSELDNEFITKRYNNYNVIQDGVYRTSTLPIVATSNSQIKAFKDFLQENNVNFDAKGMEINVKMDGIPMITRGEARKHNNVNEFANKYIEAETQKLKAYVLKQVNDILKKEDGATKGEIKTYSEETKAFLKEIGVGYDGSYSPILGDKLPMTDKFEYKILNFELNGLKNTTGKIAEYYDYTPGSRVSQVKLILNKIYNEVKNEVLKKHNINIENIVVGNYQMKDSQELFEQLHKIYVEEKTKTDKLLKEIDSIRFGKVLTGSFFDDITQDDKGNFAINYNSKILGDGVINVTMEKIVEGGDIPSEDKDRKENELTR